jgi:hypothetical protein
MIFLLLIVVIAGLFYASFRIIQQINASRRRNGDMDDITSHKSGEPNRASRYPNIEERKNM